MTEANIGFYLEKIAYALGEISQELKKLNDHLIVNSVKGGPAGPKRLGEILCENNLITRSQLEKGLQIQQEIMSRENRKVLLGEILVQYGFVDAKEIERALKVQAGGSGTARDGKRFTFSIDARADELVVAVGGRIDEQNQSTRDVERRVREQVGKGSKNVVLDVTALEFLAHEAADFVTNLNSDVTNAGGVIRIRAKRNSQPVFEIKAIGADKILPLEYV